MSAQLALVPTGEVELSEPDVLIHVRYTPSADIFSIDALPAHMSPREWLNSLLAGYSDLYQTFAGGRGFFRIPRDRFDRISTRAV